MSEGLVKLLEYRNGAYQGMARRSEREGLGIFIWDSGEVSECKKQ